MPQQNLTEPAAKVLARVRRSCRCFAGIFVGHAECFRAGVGLSVFAAVAASGEAGAELERVEGGPECALVPVQECGGGFGGAGVVGGPVGDNERGEFFDGDGVAVPAVREPVAGVGPRI